MMTHMHIVMVVKSGRNAAISAECELHVNEMIEKRSWSVAYGDTILRGCAESEFEI